MSGIATLQPTFILSKASLKELEGVKPELVATVKRAIEITIQDFTVFDGIRSVKEQQQHVANGTSQTMKSKHLDGLAVDLVPRSEEHTTALQSLIRISYAVFCLKKQINT